MKKSLIVGLIALGMIFCSGSAMAYDYSTFGGNITVYDGNGDGTESGWWKGMEHGPADNPYEDQEVEWGDGTPHALGTQAWDMEAFFWDNSNQKLTMVGGYDLINGEGNTSPGDIFIDVFDQTTGIDINGQNYDYAIRFDNSGTASVYSLTSSSAYTNASVSDFQFSNPVSLNLNGESMTAYNSAYVSGLDDGLGITGGSHNALTLELSGLGLTTGSGFAAHFTMSCGNDNLKGSFATGNEVPIPGAIWLLGSGLFGLIGIRRRRQS